MQVSHFTLALILSFFSFTSNGANFSSFIVSENWVGNASTKPISVSSTIAAATVYTKGALIVRRGSMTIEAGNFDLAFNGLERGIQEESIQLYLDNSVGVFSLALGSHTDDPKEKPVRMQTLYVRLDSIRRQIALLEADRAGYQEELTIMTAHRNFNGGAETGISVDDIRAAGELYRERTTSIKRALVELNYQKGKLNLLINKLNAELTELAPPTPPTTGQVVSRVIAQKAGTYTFELSYLVNDASWTSDYDLYVEGEASRPADLILVANVQQNTGMAWEDVDLTLSTGNPNRKLAPTKLIPRYIGHSPAASVNANSGKTKNIQGAYDPAPRYIQGVVRDDLGEPLVGVTVLIYGSKIGTTTDMDGRYIIENKMNTATPSLQLSYVGYESYTCVVHSGSVDFYFGEPSMVLEEVVVVGYGSNKDRSEDSYTPPPPAPITFGTEQATITTRTYHVDAPFSAESGTPTNAVRLVAHTLPLDLRYTAAPKVEPVAYLEAMLTGWDELNLVSGTLRLHLDGRYIGKSLFNAAQESDTLLVPLGPDDRIVLQRRPLKQKTDRRPIRSRVDYDLGYEITVRNTLSRTIKLHLEDQVPVSQRDEVKVDIIDRSGDAKFNVDTGSLVWQLSLKPATTELIRVGYTVSAPKSVAVLFE